MRAWTMAVVAACVVAGGSARAKPAAPAPAELQPAANQAVAAARPAVTVAEAERLAATAGDVHVPGPTLSVEAARRLAEHAPGRLICDDLGDLPPAVAEAIAMHPGGVVFAKLARLSPEAARELALAVRGGLSLPALIEPHPRTLLELAAIDAPLALDGLRSLPPDVAERLKQRRRKTSLRGVTKVGDRETTWREWAGPAAATTDPRDDASDFDGEDDDPDEDDIPGEKSRRGRRGGDPDEDDADGDADDSKDDSGIIGDDG